MPARSRHVEEYVLLSPPMICTYRIQGEDRAPFQQVILLHVVFRHSSPLGGALAKRGLLSLVRL